VIKIKITKTNREREIPMDGFLRKTLLWFKDNAIDFRRVLIMPRKPEQMEYVFCDNDGSQITTFRGGFRKARARAGLTDITIHTLRHTYASHLANKGIPLLTIRDLLGHSDIKTTVIYAHLTNEHLQNAVKVIDYGLEGKNAISNLCFQPEK
jgi:site-specific recombinase XerD